MWAMLRKYQRGLAEICVLFSMASALTAPSGQPRQHTREKQRDGHRILTYDIYIHFNPHNLITQGKKPLSKNICY